MEKFVYNPFAEKAAEIIKEHKNNYRKLPKVKEAIQQEKKLGKKYFHILVVSFDKVRDEYLINKRVVKLNPNSTSMLALKGEPVVGKFKASHGFGDPKNTFTEILLDPTKEEGYETPVRTADQEKNLDSKMKELEIQIEAAKQVNASLTASQAPASEEKQ